MSVAVGMKPGWFWNIRSWVEPLAKNSNHDFAADRSLLSVGDFFDAHHCRARGVWAGRRAVDVGGVAKRDQDVPGLVEPIAPVTPSDLAPSHVELARRVTSVWTAFRGRGGVPAVQLCGNSPGDCRAVAAAAAAAVGLRALAIAADLIPAAAAELDALLRLWEREAAFGGAVLLVECDGPDPAAGDDDARSRASGTDRLDADVPRRLRRPHCRGHGR